MKRIATTLPFTELEVATGNFDTSRTTIDRIIIHTMVGTWQAAAARFDNPTSQVSAHYGVKLDGGLIHWLEEYNTAFHAGNYAMNQQSIGIEHEDNGDFNGVRPDVLYTSSANLVRDICNFYNIPIDRQHILKHSEVIATGCPDALDIDRIVREAAGQPAVPSVDQKTLDDLRTARDNNWNLYQTELQKNTDLTKKVGDLTNENTGLKVSISETQANYSKCLTDLAATQKADSTAIDAGIKAEADLKTEQSNEAQISKQLGMATFDIKAVLDAVSALQKPSQEVVAQVVPTMDEMWSNLVKTKPLTFWDKVRLLFQ